MILLDTDHVTLLKYMESERGAGLAERLQARPADQVLGISIVSVEEQMRGWLAAIAKERHARRQVLAYQQLAALFEYFRTFTIAPFDERSAEQFDAFRAAKIRL